MRAHTEIKLARPRMERIHWIRDEQNVAARCYNNAEKSFSFHVLSVIDLIMPEQTRRIAKGLTRDTTNPVYYASIVNSVKKFVWPTWLFKSSYCAH